jgi:hypothetical protein
MNKKYSKSLLVFCMCLSIGLFSYAQQVISSSGAYYTNSTGSLSVTIGETVVSTVSNSSINLILTQGFQQSQNQSSLPLQLIAFNAKKENNHIALQWKTIQEYNIKSFTLLRSVDGINFEPVGTVAPINNPSLENIYQFKDQYSNTKTVYYKILITEKDGSSSHSWIVSLSSRSEEIKVYPVPVKSTLTIEVNQTNSTKTTVQLFDLSGKLLFNQNYNLVTGLNRITLNIAHLPQGTYLLRGLNETSIKIIKEN